MPPKNPKFDVKRKYQRIFEIGIIIAISITIMAFKYFPSIDSEPFPMELEKDYVEIEDVVRTEDLQKPPIPPKPVFPIDVELVDDELTDIEIETSELNENAEVGEVEIEMSDETDLLPIPFWVVEDKPEIIGGLSILQNKVIYPELAIKAGIQGKVILETVIGKDGKPELITIIKGIGAGCDEAAIEAVRKTEFKAGMQRGKPVRVKMVIPISFVLRN